MDFYLDDWLFEYQSLNRSLVFHLKARLAPRENHSESKISYGFNSQFIIHICSMFLFDFFIEFYNWFINYYEIVCIFNQMLQVSCDCFKGVREIYSDHYEVLVFEYYNQEIFCEHPHCLSHSFLEFRLKQLVKMVHIYKYILELFQIYQYCYFQQVPKQILQLDEYSRFH